jgi:hypothetical protein
LHLSSPATLKKNIFLSIFVSLLVVLFSLIFVNGNVVCQKKPLNFLMQSLLDAVTSVPYSKKGLGYAIGRGLDAILPFT